MYASAVLQKSTISIRIDIFLILFNFLIFIFFIYFYQLEANYFTLLQCFLSYTDMNQPWIYMYSPSRSPPPLPSRPDPFGSSQTRRQGYTIEQIFLKQKILLISFFIVKISSNVCLHKRELTNVNFSKMGDTCILPLCK